MSVQGRNGSNIAAINENKKWVESIGFGRSLVKEMRTSIALQKQKANHRMAYYTHYDPWLGDSLSYKSLKRLYQFQTYWASSLLSFKNLIPTEKLLKIMRVKNIKS
jgi:hypothetical protein